MVTQSSALYDQLFSALCQSSSNVEYLTGASLSRGVDLYQKGNYSSCIEDFKRVIGLGPTSDNAAKAYSFLGTAYLQLNRTDDAIAAYKEYSRSFPSSDDPHNKLGNIYFDQKRYAEAEKEYKAAVNLNSQSATNWYSLGQAYLAEGQYDEAQNAFTKVKQISPMNYSGCYGLGQVYYKRGEYKEAINQFQQVLEMKRDFTAVHVDLGYAYADMGDMDNANQQVKLLNNVDQASANLLSAYVNKISPPTLLAAYSVNGFSVAFAPGTALSSLDPSLSNAGASKDFTMNFIFSKEMDAASVQDPYNWEVMRAAPGTPGGAYNWGLPVPPTETQITLFPKSVVYDPDSLSAKVTFEIDQNASANGTVDPSHIMFKFSGSDSYGNSMDPQADEYGGLSLIV